MSFLVAAKALLVWTVILVFAVLNGLVREAVFVTWLGSVVGTMLSGVLLGLIVLAVTYLLLPWVGARGAVNYVFVGAGWLVLTLVFEFALGLHRGQAFSVMLAAYTFEGGNLWPIVLLVTLVSPWLVAKIRGLP